MLNFRKIYNFSGSGSTTVVVVVVVAVTTVAAFIAADIVAVEDFCYLGTLCGN